MARASFTLRLANGNLPATAGNYPLLAGSYLQYPPSYDATASSQSYLSLPGVAGSYATSPDADTPEITGDIEIVARVSLDDWTPAAVTTVVGKFTTGSFAYRLYVDTTGAIGLQWSTDGTSTLTQLSSVPTFVNGTAYWIRARLDVVNGTNRVIDFHYAPNQSSEPTTWNTISTHTVAGNTSIYGLGTSPITFGAHGVAGANGAMAGKMYRAIIRNGVTGNSAIDIDFTQSITYSGQSSLLASTGQTVTVTGATTVFLAGLRATGLDDGYLKGDGVLQAGTLSNVIPGGNSISAAAYFTANAVDYSQVHLTWGVPLATTLTTTPQPTQVIIAYSDQGEPDTISEGVSLVETTTDSEYYHVVESGKWAYYTLFLKYESSIGDLYYLPAAKLSTLVPNDYGSTNSLYSKIPLYYRLLDGNIDDGSGGPLYRFLSVFGWDIDFYRTLLDYLISSKDPHNTRAEELVVLANDLGLDVTSDQLGAKRLRAFMDEIGNIRRNNGTSTGVITALTALTGSEVTIDTATKKIRIRPQRVNLIKDPKLVSGLAGADGGAPSTSSFSNIYDAATAGTASAAYTTFLDGGSAASSFAATGYWNSTTDATQPGISILEGNAATVYMAADKVYYFSVHTSAQDMVTKVGFVNTTGTRTYITSQTTPTVIGNRKYWKLTIPSTYSGTPTLAALRIEFTTPAVGGASDYFAKLLLEENNIGDYFDGASTRGGWVVDTSNNKVSDYQWYEPSGASASANASFSVYNDNFQKTKAVIAQFLPLLLPVTELATTGVLYSNVTPSVTKWSITYNYLPGY